MNNDAPLDLLQVKIEKAKENLSEETLLAIGAVDWKKAILDMRQGRGLSFEQLEDLELETELLLCGLESPDDYPKEIERRLGLSKPQVSDLVKDLNEKIFKPIREEFIKITEAKKQETGEEKEIFERNLPKENLKETVRGESPEEILRVLEKERELPAAPAEAGAAGPAFRDRSKTETGADSSTFSAQKSSSAIKEEFQPILIRKLTGSWKAPVKNTEYTLPNVNEAVTKPIEKPDISPDAKSKADPYREIPE